MPKPYTQSGTVLCRRRFIKYHTVTATVLGLAPEFLRGQDIHSRVHVAGIGVGGKSTRDVDPFVKREYREA